MAIRKREPFLGLGAGDTLGPRGINKYQAVLAAAKMARRLNQEKVAEYEASPESDRTLEAHKVTSIALEMLLAGEIELSTQTEQAGA
jgi:DNA-directed RNA polymerase omega subunit